MRKPRVLIIDDDPAVCYSFRRALEQGRFQVLMAPTAAAGVETFDAERPEVVVLDLNLPDGSGMEVFHAIRDRSPRCPVLFVTAHGSTDTALQAMKEGAFDYLIKPVDLDRLLLLLDRALETARLMQPPGPLPSEGGDDRIIGRSPLMQEMCKLIGLLAPQDVNVLITGESGTGKELVARALYHHSRRADRAFLAINCAALPEQLLESELFGHEQGAFTGAIRQRIGKFEQCRDGTLFLDEIGDMSLAVQAKMLRVLQDQRFERVGGNQTVETRVRLLAATNQNLDKLVAEGRFRADLYYRLRVATVRVPPLRDRREDVPELAHHFLFVTSRKVGRDLRGFSPEALACLQHYHWPGNVRELQSVVKEAAVRTRGHLVLPEYLPEHLGGRPAPPAGEDGLDMRRLLDALFREGETELYSRFLREVDRFLLSEVMARTQGNKLRASEMLGIDRKTLRQKLRSLGLLPPATPESDDDSVAPTPRGGGQRV
ncbi:MAG TPA: sigma-54 dependent transcriptional regulator [Gemmataceae bacterium]|nr:sigma-54 dependent transcriptional regulator [Gemmataceae bacterium]